MEKIFLSLLTLLSINGFGQAVKIVAPVTADTALSVHQNGSGPVLSLINNNTSGNGALIYGEQYGNGDALSVKSNKSKAAKFSTDPGNTDTIVSIESDASGMGLNVALNNAANPASALRVSTKGQGVVISADQLNTTSNNNAMNVTNWGLGYGATVNTFNSNSNAATLKINNVGTAEGLNIWMANSNNNSPGFILGQQGYGKGISIQMSNTSNGERGLEVMQSGVGPGVFASTTTGNSVWGVASSAYAAAIIGDNYYGECIVGRGHGPLGVGAVVGRNDSTGYGVRGFVTRNGIGVLGEAGNSGGTGLAGKFENVNAANGNYVLYATGSGLGPTLCIENTNGNAISLAIFRKNGTTVARINEAGKGFFNGGTQNSGADLAEAFDVENDISMYEPGDVLTISTDRDRAVRKSAEPYSDLVAGVYATKPGVLLTEENIETDLTGKVPMGVVGVIPTKVCMEGGEIKRGDLLVTSSMPGIAMKADKEKLKTGQCIGKALENYNAAGIKKIKVLVSIK